jgi:hypothetical protein
MQNLLRYSIDTEAKIMISLKTASIFFLLAFSISLASADETRTHEFDASDVDTLRIDARVGMIIVEPSRSGKFEVELLISNEKKRRWFSRTPDTSSMDLKSSQRGSQLRLSFDHKDVKTDWVVRVPDILQIEIELGVGTVETYGIAAAFITDVGVGTIDIRTPADSAGLVELSVGVGETAIRGGTSVNNRRSLVSSQASALGQGNSAIRAEVGVGSVEVTLQ